MDTEQFIKDEIRLQAIEYLVCRMYVTLLRQSGLSVAELGRHYDKFVEDAGNQMFPGFDPAMSDFVNAEWQSAIERLVKAQKEMLAQA